MISDRVNVAASTQSSRPNRRQQATRALVATGWTIAVITVMAYAAYLRLDGMFGRYGPYTHPAWLVALQDTVAATRADYVPEGWTWARVESGYTGGDPVNYIQFARDMTAFYQAHVREPVFLAATRGWLMLTDGQDVAVSLASVSFSTLAVLATFLLGGAVASRPAGFAAAVLMAIEGELVAWAPDGWRDDAFMAMFALSAWAIVRFDRHPTWVRATVLGVVGAAATLTRITSLSFLLPGLLFLAVSHGWPRWQTRGRFLVGAISLLALLVAPYLINCAREFGDAFYSINAHTRYYRASEGVAFEEPMSALDYTVSKLRQRPIGQMDTAIRGLVVHPFETKFRGFTAGPAWLGTAVAWLAAIGLFAWLWSHTGRLLLLLLFASLAPYMLTWALRGGGEWRFTMHVYPFYLVAATVALQSIIAMIWAAAARGREAWRLSAVAWTPVLIRASTAVVMAAGGVWWGYISPALVARELLRDGESTSVSAGPADRIFFRDGWSELSTAGAVVSRFAIVQQPVLYIPLPERRPYRLVLRMDPVQVGEGVVPQVVRVALDDRPLGEITLTFDPNRVGSHTLEIPADRAGRSLARLTFSARDIQPAGAAAARHPGLAPSTPAAFRLWYARLTPG
jgi:hypothetical protein